MAKIIQNLQDRITEYYNDFQILLAQMGFQKDQIRNAWQEIRQLLERSQEKWTINTPHTRCPDRYDSVDWDIYCYNKDNKGKTFIVCNTELPKCRKSNCPLKA